MNLPEIGYKNETPKLKHRKHAMNWRPKEAWERFEPDSNVPWTLRRAAHLLRRSAFGGSIEDIKQVHQDGMDTSVERIMSVQSAFEYDAEMEASGRLVASGNESESLAAWWLLRMLQTPCPFQEKLTLFWHGHFATGADKVKDARAMFTQNTLLRSSCLGNYQPLVKAISRDVAMLVYLDSTENRKTRPNENYARELLELFCLGPGHYSEQDIKELARCFTGWEVRKQHFKFNSYQHDNGSKSVLGKTADMDGDQAIEVILRQPAAARFIAKKLVRFYVTDDTNLSDEFVQPLADALRETEFDIRHVVKKILCSRYFYSAEAAGTKIKSPVELAIGLLWFLEATTNVSELTGELRRLGQLPLYPPNVKGWDGGKIWINASTILARANLSAKLITGNQTKYRRGGFDAWLEHNTRLAGGKTPLSWLNEYLLVVPLGTERLATFEKQMKSNPAQALAAVTAMPEFQIN